MISPIIFMATLSLMVMWLHSPFYICFLLILGTLLLGVWSAAIASKWVACAISLIFLGGMMVVFFYACSLSSNSKMEGSSALYLATLCFILSVVLTKYGSSAPVNSVVAAGAVYNFSSAPMLVILLAYLITTLFTSVKMTQSFKGSIVKSN